MVKISIYLNRRVVVMKPAHPHSLIRVFVVRIEKLHRLLPKYAPSKDSYQTACANAQADLNRRWAHMSGCTFPDIATQSVPGMLWYLSKMLRTCERTISGISFGVLANGFVSNILNIWKLKAEYSRLQIKMKITKDPILSLFYGKINKQINK